MRIKRIITKFLKKNPLIYWGIKRIINDYCNNRILKMNKQDLMIYDAKLYKKHTGATLDWSDLNSYTEKMQYDKLYNTDSRKTIYSDKLQVRDYVRQKIGSEFLVKIYQVYDNIEDIEWNDLPQNFVIRTNNSSGDTVVVKDKELLSKKDLLDIKCRLNYFLHSRFGIRTVEFHYLDIEPRIIVEELLESDMDDLPDYKFLCFDGVPYFCWVDIDRNHGHKRNFYDMDWNLQNWQTLQFQNTDFAIPKPTNFDKMKKIVAILCQGFPQVRIDLYNVNGQIYFGEMTFTNGSGFEPIIPEEVNLMLGNLWKL